MSPDEIYKLPDWIRTFWMRHEDKLSDSIYAPEVFGNFCLVFEFGHAQLRIVRDRLSISVDVKDQNDGPWVEIRPGVSQAENVEGLIENWIGQVSRT